MIKYKGKVHRSIHSLKKNGTLGKLSKAEDIIFDQ